MVSGVKWIITIILIAILAVILLYPHRTGNTEIGVRTVKFGIFGKKGVVDKVYEPASIYFFPAVFNDWHVFDKRILNLEMTFSGESADRRQRDDLLFKTIDGNDISLDVILTYRIIPEKAPYILQNVAADMEELKDNIVRTIGRSKPRDIFGELTTEEFYESENREAKAVDAKDILNNILNEYGVHVERVSTRDYRFSPDYTKAIEDKKIADQMVEKNRSERNAVVEEYKRKLQDAVGEVNKMIAVADGDYEQAKIEADAYYEKQGKLAQAIENEGIAEAEGIRKMNEALSGAGGEIMVKMKLAEALKDKKIILIPTSGEGGVNFKTLNINELLSMQGLKSISDKDK